jgi:DNA repair protein RecN (Recombination protein N)
LAKDAQLCAFLFLARTLNSPGVLGTLRIKNLALVTDLTLCLRPGYNAITGETGAGKSIIIGALNLLLGGRADRTLIRAGCDSCSVEAVLQGPERRPALDKFLEENGLEPCAGGELILKRAFTAAGANRQFINGSPAPLQALAALGRELVDMHGPHDHQSLFDPARQRDILDAFAGLEGLRGKFAALAARARALEAEKAALIVDEREYARQLELLRFQAGEISAAQLQPDEETRLEQEFQRASNAARLLELSQTALNLLCEQENCLLAQAGELGRTLQALQQLDTGARSLLPAHEQAAAAWRDLQSGLRRYADAIDLDPGRLRQLEERLDLIHSLQRKYGGTLEEVIAFGAEAGRKLQQLEQRETELARLNQERGKLDGELWAAGRELSAQRRKAVPRLAKSAMKELRDLGFAQSRFDITVNTTDSPPAHAASGLDEIDFQFAPNPGEPARPLRSIASSGEMSRVMLALKTVLAEEDAIPVLVFDEIDANVGGATAAAVGEKMRHIARRRQVICITHLPAVAAAAEWHFVVAKRVEGGRTVSEITLLDEASRTGEIARMLGGQTEAALRHAEELLAQRHGAEASRG